MSPEGAQDGDPDDLPMRLGQVAALIALGYSDKQIAAELRLSPHTIHRHVVRLLKRLGVENRAAAAAVWARRTMDVQQGSVANGLAADRRTSKIASAASRHEAEGAAPTIPSDVDATTDSTSSDDVPARFDRRGGGP